MNLISAIHAKNPVMRLCSKQARIAVWAFGVAVGKRFSDKFDTDTL